jgi:hypothetical protein
MFASVITWLRLKRYPRTPQGRRSYIKDNTSSGDTAITNCNIGLLVEIPILIVLAPVILMILLGYFIYWILTGLGIFCMAFSEGLTYLWGERQ